jgi:hypothetical protein
MTNAEIRLFIKAMKEITSNIDDWKRDYVYDPATNDYFYTKHTRQDMSPLFSLED